MAAPRTMQHVGRSDWPLMTAIHNALRRDLDELLHTPASRTAARARWIVFRDHLRFHLAAENAAMWPLARAKLTCDAHGQTLVDAMEDEQWLIGPLQAVIDDAFAMHADTLRLRRLLTRLRTRLTSHLALRKPMPCRSWGGSCPRASSAASTQPSAAGAAPSEQRSRSPGLSPTPAPTSALRY